MSYIVLARKCRPQKFDELIGQEHITKILESSIQSKRLAHAFLFSGPRGVGKTSCARIFAKSLNCKEGPTLTPCGVCPACKEIANGTSFDVIEIDGASNRGIDEIRTLRENVKFAPSYGRFKVYIVDEVHMLTTEAFNALLKTLEEPPEHVKFIFATTAPNKVPVTIISRCQRFDFRRIAVETTVKALSAICKKEKLDIAEEALFAIAKAASGSLRDALSILDQLSALRERKINIDDVTSMLGMVEIELLFTLADCLAKKDCPVAFKVFDDIINQGKDIKQLTRDIIEHFRNLLIMKVGGKSLGSLVDYPIATKETLLTQAQNFALTDIIHTIDVLVESQETSRVTESLRIPLEVAFAKLTRKEHKPENKSEAPPDLKISEKAPAKGSVKNSEASWPAADMLSNRKGHVDFSFSSAAPKEEAKRDVSEFVSEEPAPESVTTLDLDVIRKSWDVMTHAISREKMSVATFLQEGSPYDCKGTRLTIGFPKEALFSKESLEQKDNLQLIEKVFSSKLRADVKVELRIVADHKPQQQEPAVQTAIDTFHGKVVNEWHKDS